MALEGLWIAMTLAAAAAQTARNAMQGRLAHRIGTLGATQARFLFGFPFALVFLAIVRWIDGAGVPAPNLAFAGFVLVGAVAQIAATALLVAAMRRSAFSIAIALTKTEPVQVALVGAVALGDALPPSTLFGVLASTVGVLLVSMPGFFGDGAAIDWRRSAGPALLGLLAGAGFAAAAIGFRGAILSLDEGSALIRATTALVYALGLQTLLLGGFLGIFQRRAFIASLAEWASLGAGFMGALASQFWFIAFALTSAANVRTLALVEILFAQIISRRVFREQVSRQELAGLVLILAGVAGVLWAARA